MSKLYHAIARFKRVDGSICESFLCTKRRDNGEFKSKSHAQKVANEFNIRFQKTGYLAAFVREV